MKSPRFARVQAQTATVCAALAVGLAAVLPADATDSCPYTCGDLDGDGAVQIADFYAFADCLGQPPGSPACLCADLDGSGAIDMRDFGLFSLVYRQFSDEWPPHCTGALGITADFAVYRPQHGAGYAPYARTAVADENEESPTWGPGVRCNVPGDVDPAGEDDLIEVELRVAPPGAQVALRRGAAALQVWTSRSKQPGTNIAFTDDLTGALPLGPLQTELTIWVEWAGAEHGTATLDVEPLSAAVSKDTLVFHTFQSIVVALGGENQVPTDPADPTAGTFEVAIDLYERGYDVHMYDEDDVDADGTGATFDEVANAVQNRGVQAVAIFGYSHGGGSTYSLADLLDLSRPALGPFEISFTSYVDSVRNNSDFDVAQELRRPPSSLQHLNQYQHGVFIEDLGLDGGPVPDSSPPPTGLDVETTAWGAGATHFEIDDFTEVRDLVEASLDSIVTPEQEIPAMKSLEPMRDGRFRAAGTGPRARSAIPLIVVAAQHGELASGPGAPEVIVNPDPAIQAAIADVARADVPPQQSAALARLRAWDDATHRQLVQQLLYYSSRADDTKDALVAGALLRPLDIPDSAVVQALVPLLGTADRGLRRSVRNVLGGFEGRAAGRRPDFSAYRDIIAEQARTGQQPADALIRYLYESDPSEALLTLMRAYQVKQPAELRALLWAEHVVSDVLWKQRNGFLEQNELEPGAVQELARLARHEAWWVRLYVAEIMRQHPVFRQTGLIADLKRDAHAAVRESASAADGGK